MPFFVSKCKCSEAALVPVVQETFVQGVSTRKIKKLAENIGLYSLGYSLDHEMNKGLNEPVEEFSSVAR